MNDQNQTWSEEGVMEDRQLTSGGTTLPLRVRRRGWSCPRCGTETAPRETPAGTFCSGCHEKLESCCEGAPLPAR